MQAKSLHCHRLECSVAYGKRLEGLAHSCHPPTQRAHCPTTLWLGQTHRAPALTPSQAYTMKPLTCAHNRSGWKISHAPLNMRSHYFWPIAPLCSETIIEREMPYVPLNWSPPSLNFFYRVDSFNLIAWVIFGRFPFTLMHVCFPIGPPSMPKRARGALGQGWPQQARWGRLGRRAFELRAVPIGRGARVECLALSRNGAYHYRALAHGGGTGSSHIKAARGLCRVGDGHQGRH